MHTAVDLAPEQATTAASATAPRQKQRHEPQADSHLLLLPWPEV